MSRSESEPIRPRYNKSESGQSTIRDEACHRWRRSGESAANGLSGAIVGGA